MPTRVLVPSGVLGLGFDRDALSAGIERSPDLISIDGGSTDSGPHYLGTGTSKYSRASTLAEWRELLEAAAGKGIPVVLTSAGTCGTDATVDWMVEITDEAARLLGRTLRIATLKSSQKNESVAQAFTANGIHPLAHGPALSGETIGNCTNIVALAGIEQIGSAIRTGADVVIAGRATDTAGIAALPILNGEHVGCAWHGAKIGECGALCSTRPMSGVIEIDFDEGGCSVEPMASAARCTPDSVSAHMLYENSDPTRLQEPGGTLDVRDAAYRALSDRRVRIEGSRWLPSPSYRVKLEGAGLAGYQTTALVMLRSERYVANAEAWARRLGEFLEREIPSRTGFDPASFSVEFRLIGINAALGELETKGNLPNEVGVLFIATSGTQERATEIAKLANPFLLHFPLSEGEELPTFAFPFSPAESERGPTFEFLLNHVMELEDPMDAFRLEQLEVGNGALR